MIAELNRDDVSGMNSRSDAFFEIARLGFDLRERCAAPSRVVSNSGRIILPRDGAVSSHAARIWVSSLAYQHLSAKFATHFPYMKADIHPEYNETEIVLCVRCGLSHTLDQSDIKIGICAACHPFFTGEQKFVDTAGRVEKFARRYGSTKADPRRQKA